MNTNPSDRKYVENAVMTHSAKISSVDPTYPSTLTELFGAFFMCAAVISFPLLSGLSWFMSLKSTLSTSKLDREWRF